MFLKAVQYFSSGHCRR